jgi:5-formyltetrahydrofolate cyclo-ligase
MENPSVQKEKLRKTLCLLTKQQDPAELDKESRLICNKLEGSPEFKEAQNLLLYYSLPDEVSTLELIQRWYKHKNILLPVIVNESTMVLRLYTGKKCFATESLGYNRTHRRRFLDLRRDRPGRYSRCGLR